MKKTISRAVLVLALIAAVAVAAVVRFFRVPDPQYNGKHLSEWLRAMNRQVQYGVNNPQINAVVQQIDAEGIDSLRWALRSNSYLESSNYYKFYSWTWPGLRKRLPNPSHASLVRQNAAWMLCELKAKAEPALPELRNALLDRKSQQSERIRELAARTIVEFGPKAGPAIPELEQALNDPSETVVECVARALGGIGPAAQHALPNLEARLGQRRDFVGVAIGEAIWNIDPSRSNTVAQVLLECLRDGNYYSQIYGSQALWNMRMETKATVPVLVAVLADPKAAFIHIWSIGILGQMGTNAQAAAPILEEKTHDHGPFSGQIQKAAADALVRIRGAQGK